MDRYKETFETWNKIASLYEDKFMYLDLYNETYEFICNSIDKKNAKVLDVGCGPGNITKYLLSVRPEFDILGIDIAPNMIELAKKNNPTATFSLLDIRNIDDIKTKFDAVVCGFCLPYLSNIDSYKLIKDCYSLLNDNGLIYLSFVEGDYSKSQFQVGSSGYRSYFYYYNLNDLTKLLAENNFKECKEFKVTYKKTENHIDIHTILIAKKKTAA
jgi:2-polyprenyl-3-methyl-5-hydroxy-6-metoxy-1,4-benzoquinol methylase